MKDLIQKTGEQLLLLRERHHALFSSIVEVNRAMKTRGTPLPDLVDLCWLLRNMKKLTEDMKKELNKLEESLAAIVAYRWTMQASGNPIRGDLATGSPDVRAQPYIPRRSDNPEQYDAFLRSLGIPEELVQASALRVDFEGIGNFLTDILSSGKPVPDSFRKFGEPSTRASLRLTTKRNNPYDSEESLPVVKKEGIDESSEV